MTAKGACLYLYKVQGVSIGGEGQAGLHSPTLSLLQQGSVNIWKQPRNTMCFQKNVADSNRDAASCFLYLWREINAKLGDFAPKWVSSGEKPEPPCKRRCCPKEEASRAQGQLSPGAEKRQDFPGPACCPRTQEGHLPRVWQDMGVPRAANRSLPDQSTLAAEDGALTRE